MDGSKPDETSPIYEQPIHIEDASNHDNIYSDRTDISFGFDAGMGYKVPDFPVDKCNVVRAAQFDSEGICVSEASRVFFVGFDKKSGYNNMQIISMITDPDNLFDNEKGIYVIGAEYEGADNNNAWTGRPANYNARGIEWEREAIIDVFDGINGNLLESSAAGIRIHGGVSRALAKKSFNLYARSCYSGSDVFMTDFFDNGKPPHKMILSSGGNDEKINLKNYIVQKLAVESDSQCATTEMIPCALFLNGEYWGFYYLTEAYDADYISTHYGVDEEDIIMWKNDTLEEGIDEDYRRQYDMVTFISKNDMSIEGNYEQACEIIDIESFIDYYALEIYIANQDWLPNNCAYWKTRKFNSRNLYYDEKWRWMLFDTDQWAILAETNDDTIAHAIDKDSVFASLIQNKEVQKMLRERLMELQDIYAENCDEWIDEWLAMMSDSVYQNGERYWGVNGIDSWFQNMIDGMREYSEARIIYLNKYMEQHFNG